MKSISLTSVIIAMSALVPISGLFATEFKQAQQPNILFIFTDDHALKAISAYGGPLKKIAPTPHLDALAAQGALFERSYCANSICGPSRACILTGKHSHVNGFKTNNQHFNGKQWTFPKQLQQANYTTAVIGKWHLHSRPTGFDHWEILPGQGSYYNPDFISMDKTKVQEKGYVTDIVTQKAIDWLDKRDTSKPFMLMCQHKAPHRNFSPALRHLGAFDDVEIPEPSNLFDDYAGRSQTLAKNRMSLARHFHWAYDLKIRREERKDSKLKTPDGYPAREYDRMDPEQKKTMGRLLYAA